MTKSFKFFLIPFVLSFPFWWGINNLQAELLDVFYYREFTHNSKILAAQANQMEFEERIKTLKPLRDGQVPDLTVTARGAISLLINNLGREKILFEKDIDQQLPIASLTKLMTAYIVLEHYDLNKEIKVSKEAVQQEENLGKLAVGEALSVEILLYPLLIESSNDAAFSLANDYDGMTEQVFVELMNLEAQQLGMENTLFSNVTGLDSETSDPTNYSTVHDLTVLARALLDKPLVWQILSTSQINLYGPTLTNSNRLLVKIPLIIGGKTGYTEEALGCFLLVLEAPSDHRYLINVILGTNNGRFSEMEKLIEWVNKAYKW